MKKLTLALIATLLITGCADTVTIESCINDDPYGFWSGLWHGIISPISFFGSIIFDGIDMYAKNNNGGWYDFGFCVGAGILFGTTSKSI